MLLFFALTLSWIWCAVLFISLAGKWISEAAVRYITQTFPPHSILIRGSFFLFSLGPNHIENIFILTCLWAFTLTFFYKIRTYITFECEREYGASGLRTHAIYLFVCAATIHRAFGRKSHHNTDDTFSGNMNCAGREKSRKQKKRRKR